MPETRILLIRHGQTGWNEGAGQARYRGQTDIPLDEVGHAQAHALAARLIHEPIDGIYSSPLQRAVQTAQPTADQHRLPVVAHPGLLDMNLGEWQGLTQQQAADRYPHLHRQWLAAPHTVTLPGGENLATVLARAQAAVIELVARHSGGGVMLVGHQVINKVLLCWLLGLDNAHYWRMTQDNACLNEFVHSDGIYCVVRINDTCHLR
ncbi:MAG: histidine phosphatase family protein [Chloroflexota bacterium]